MATTYESVPPVNGSISPNPTIDTYLAGNKHRKEFWNLYYIPGWRPKWFECLPWPLKIWCIVHPCECGHQQCFTVIDGYCSSVEQSIRHWCSSNDEGLGRRSPMATNGTPNWNDYSGGNPWTTAGGDYNATVRATTSVSTTGTYNWSLTGLVQDWVNGISSIMVCYWNSQ